MSESGEALEQAYRNMMARLKTGWDMMREQTMPSLKQQIQQVVEKTSTLEELTEEEAARIGSYLKRDIEDAAQFIVETDQELQDWLQFDLALIEESLLHVLETSVNHTRDELLKLSLDAKLVSEWHTGHITGPGTLVCTHCNSTMQFHKPGRIPPCPHCQHTVFERSWNYEDTTPPKKSRPPTL